MRGEGAEDYKNGRIHLGRATVVQVLAHSLAIQVAMDFISQRGEIFLIYLGSQA